MSTFVTSVPVRSLMSAVSLPPSALEIDGLSAVDVHDDVAEITGEAEPSGDGRGLEGLVAPGAVELHRVVAA